MRQVGAPKRAFHARLPPIFTVGKRFCSFDTARQQENQRFQTRREGAPKQAFRARLPPIFTFCNIKIDVFLRVFFSGTFKFADVSCEASVNFQHISENATFATKSAPRRHLRQPRQCDSHKTRNATRLKCCACNAK